MWTEINAYWYWHGKKVSPAFLSWTSRPPSRSHLSGLWLSSMKIFSRSQHMCRHQRPTTAWNSRGQFIRADVAIGSLFFLACAQAELLSLKFCFLTSIFLPQEHFCHCLVGQLTSNQTSSTLFIRLFCMPVSRILDIQFQARHVCCVLAPTDVPLARYFHLVDETSLIWEVGHNKPSLSRSSVKAGIILWHLHRSSR